MTLNGTIAHLQPYPELAGRAIHPTGFRLLVRPLDPETEIKLASGLVLAKPVQTVDREVGGMDLGQVLEVGPTCWKDQGGGQWCKPGDYIRFYAYKGAVVEDPQNEGKFLFLLNDLDVLGVYGEVPSDGR